MWHLEQIGNEMSVTIPKDKSGYIGRECPECKRYFKIMPGTGLPEAIHCNCPYCGHTADPNDFTTQEQIEYAKSIAIRKLTEAVQKDLKSLEFEIGPSGSFGLGISMKVERGTPHPISRYYEKELETNIKCQGCTLEYAVYGIFAFCPDCRQHNTLQTFVKSLEIIEKMLDLASGADAELSEKLVENALEDCVSAFDGFGRELCKVYSTKAYNASKPGKITFQNLIGAKVAVMESFGIDLLELIGIAEWERATICFQKRHLIAHKMGVVDDDYVKKSCDLKAVVGHKVNISEQEVRALVQILNKMATAFTDTVSIIKDPNDGDT